MLSEVVPGVSGLVVAGLRLRRLLSDEIFRERSASRNAKEVSVICHDQWQDLGDAWAALTEPLEAWLIVAGLPRDEAPGTEIVVAFLAAGRGPTEDACRAAAMVSAARLHALLSVSLDYCEFEHVESESDLHNFVGLLGAPHVVEIARRREWLRVSGTRIEQRRVGFRYGSLPESAGLGPGDEGWFRHLFPWTPSDDSWSRLLSALEWEQGRAAMVVHLRGMREAPEAAQQEAWEDMELLERSSRRGSQAGTTTAFDLQASELHKAQVERVSIVQEGVLATRLFVMADAPTSPELLAVVEGSVDDASVAVGPGPGNSFFRGGARHVIACTDEVFEPLDRVGLDRLFGVREASAVLRTPMPMDTEHAGLPIARSRTASMVGTAGGDAPIGTNLHRGQARTVALHSDERFRHVYVIGQTGTGKSTLLARMILHDIHAGRGVVVIDPHGSLVQDVLERYPMARAEDLIVLDFTDFDQPIGFNFLRIDTEDPFEYRLRRDLIIADMLALFEKLYARESMGPMFETYFRATMALLLGANPPLGGVYPTLLMLRKLYLEPVALKKRLAESRDDPMLQMMVAEAKLTSGETSWSNMSPYITSKLNRFLSDASVRNITCQNQCLDMNHIVNEGQVLLVHTGRGQIGDQAASLVSSMVVSCIRQATFRRSAGAPGHPCYVYADEFQVVADRRFTEFLAEGRKFGVALTLGHQYLDQLDPEVLQAVLGNIGTAVALRVGLKDAERMDPFFRPAFGGRDLMVLPNYQAYVRGSGGLGLAPFSVTLAPQDPARDPARAQALRERARSRYGRGRNVVEAEIRSSLDAYFP